MFITLSPGMLISNCLKIRSPERGISISVAGRSISTIRGPVPGMFIFVSVTRSQEYIHHKMSWQWLILILSWEVLIQHKISWQGHIHILSWEEHIHHKRSWKGHSHIHSWEEHNHHTGHWPRRQGER